MDTAEFCRAIEAHLCRKNDGHLIRVVGPSFEIVSAWAARGIPLKVACAGIDRYFDRYHRDGRPRRRPVRIDFCDADVLDAFDEWRRAVLVTAAGDIDDNREEPVAAGAGRRGASLPAHVERVVLRLTAARARGTLGAVFDDLIDRVAGELDAARAAGPLRGARRQALIERLALLDGELLRAARGALDEPVRAALTREADEELAAYRERMAPEAFARSQAAVVDRLLRERLGLPTIAYA